MNKRILDYVKKHMRENFGIYCDRLPKTELDAIIYAICSDLSKKFTIQQILDGSVDKVISGSINKIMKMTNPELQAERVNFQNYVKNMINEQIKYSDDTLEWVKVRVVDKLMSSYTYEQLMNGEADEEVALIFKGVEKELRKEIREYVCNYIVTKVCPYPLGVDQTVVANRIVRRVMESKKYNVSDVFRGKHNRIIHEFVNDARETEQNRVKSVAPEEAVEALTLLRENSVVNENPPKKINHNTKKRRLSKSFIALILVAVIALAAVGKVAYNIVDSVIESGQETYYDIKSVDAKNTVKDFDGFDYSYMYVRSAPRFKETMENTVKFYNKVVDKGYDSNFQYLAFYKAYENVRQDRLYIMDYMLDMACLEAKNQGNKEAYEDLYGYSCYLDFAMDSI